MSRNLKVLLAAFGTALAMTACQPSAENGISTDSGTSSGDSGSGFVISPKGGIGIDLGGGIHLDPSTGGIGFGGLPLG
ncbi:hypothetical protein [Mycolicibacterium nivoides]|uniref:hypothetical protein n=1 Tax=Mycolicibacterium nivoides TaxID=2487344 RepID=UPI000F5C21B1|nr:hypothetical protein [Mycolicibacterium nivoides]